LIYAASQAPLKSAQKQGFPMAARRGTAAFIGVVGLGLMTLGLSSPAAAEGIFERIFGGLRHAVEGPSRSSAFADPLSNPSPPQRRADAGPAKAFCVRTCDGHFFPLQARHGFSAAEACHSFCPGSETRLYSGSNIDYAVAPDGSRYADLDNAFVYRKQLVASCTCNGHDQFGLAHIDVTNDPTLRPGDVVATKNGLAAFTRTRNNVAEFTPVNADPKLAKSYRDKLSEMKIAPPTPVAANAVPMTLPPQARSGNNHSAQLSR
jgi:hypothetical protein